MPDIDLNYTPPAITAPISTQVDNFPYLRPVLTSIEHPPAVTATSLTLVELPPCVTPRDHPLLLPPQHARGLIYHQYTMSFDNAPLSPPQFSRKLYCPYIRLIEHPPAIIATSLTLVELPPCVTPRDHPLLSPPQHARWLIYHRYTTSIANTPLSPPQFSRRSNGPYIRLILTSIDHSPLLLWRSICLSILTPIEHPLLSPCQLSRRLICPLHAIPIANPCCSYHRGNFYVS